MAAKAVSVKLSEQWQDGVFKCFKRFIGGKMHYLSQDRAEAARMALALVAKWQELRANGRGWTPDVIASVLAPFRPASVPPASARLSTHLYEAIKTYLEDYKLKVSDGRHLRQAAALGAYKRFQPDCPLTSIGWDALNAAVAHFRSRPKTAKGQVMTVATVQTNVKAVHALFDWLDISGRWEAPRRFDRIFRVSYQSLKTPSELKREGNGQDVFTVAELTSLWAKASSRQRTWIGLALATGETAQGIAALMKSDIRRQGGKLVIDRNRSKTGVRGVYPLWPEVAELVETAMDRNKLEPLAFKSLDGNPLVWFHKTGRVDAIAKTWRNLLDKCSDVRRRGFSTLRKTGATIIEQLTGSLEIAQLYLSHKGQTVAEKHYLGRHFDKLALALVAMREHLRPVFAEHATTKAASTTEAA